MRTTHRTLFGLTLLLTHWTGSALANTEPSPSYDARSVGMGSTGVAHVHNGASLFHNPAGLAGVERLAITASFAPLMPQTAAPLAGPDTEVKGTRGFFPMFLVGGAYRVHRKLTLGVAAYPTMGFGTKYENVDALGGLELSAKLAAMEIAPGAAFNITDDIAVGLAYRVTYMSYTVRAPGTNPADGSPISTKADLSGWNFLGVHAGVFAKATPTTRLGLTYRNKVPVTMKGDAQAGPLNGTSEVEFAAPHAFKVGVAQSLLDDRLLLALDLKLALYKEANKSMVVKSELPVLGTVVEETRLDWKNSIGAYLGGEYRFAPEGMRARLGYSIAQSATPTSRAQPILPPPGVQQAIHLGTGLSMTNFDVDLGGYYLFGGKQAAPEGGVPGDYSMNAFLVALGGTYRM